MISSQGRAEFPALGTGAVVVVTEPEHLDAAVSAVRTEVDRFDRACSRFRSDSDLERVNDAAGRPVVVSDTLVDAVEAALRAAVWTGGDVDPTVGQALRLLGYDRDFASVRPAPSVVRFTEVPGWKVVAVDRTRSTVTVPAGVRLDLGATAKALAVDRAADSAAEAAGCGVLVSLGGDIACRGQEPASGWLVHVAEWHAAGPKAAGQTVCIHSGGIATSSTTVRRWQRGRDEMHHLVDPATGRPVNTYWRTVSVAAASCLQANVATTAAIIRGDRAEDWLASLGVPARLVRRDGTVVCLGHWPVEVAS